MILSPFTSPALSTLKQTHRHTLQILAKGSITAFLESDGLLCEILIILGSSNDASFFCLTFFSFLSYFLKKEFNCSWLYTKDLTLKLARSCVTEKQEKGRVLLSVLRALALCLNWYCMAGIWKVETDCVGVLGFCPGYLQCSIWSGKAEDDFILRQTILNY